MAKVILSAVKSRNNSSDTAPGTTQYWNLANSSLLASTTVAQRDVTWHTPGTLSKLYVRVISSSASGACTVAVRKNGIDSAMTVNIPAGFVGVVENTSDELAVADGDKLVCKTVQAAGTGVVTLGIISVLFDTVSPNPASRHTMEGYAVTAASVTHYLPIAGDRSGTTGTESSVEATIKKPCTVKNAFIFIQSNARTTTTTFTLRKNRIDTGLVFTVGAGVTGIIEDTTTSVSYTIDDEINWKITTLAGTESLSFHSLSLDIENADNYGSIFAGSVGVSSDNPVAVNTTVYAPIGGAHFFDANENNVKIKARHSFTISALTIRLGVNTVTAPSTFTLRLNGADTALSATTTPSVIGFYSNTTASVDVEPEDELSLRYTTGATGTTTTVTNYSVWMLPAAPPIVTAIGGRGSRQGRSPLYRLTKPKIVAVIIRLKVQLEYEVTRLTITVAIPYVFEKVTLIKYASAIIEPVVNILPLRKRSTPKPTVRNIVTQLSYEVQTLRLKSACAYEVDKLITRKKQIEILRIAMNFMVSDFTSYTNR